MCSASCKPQKKAMGSTVGGESENLRRSPLEVALYVSALMQRPQGDILLNGIGEYSALVVFHRGNHRNCPDLAARLVSS